jgi:hypothetical protein
MSDAAATGSGFVQLDTDNYGTWSFRMKNYLISKGLGGCIDGTAATAGSEKDQKALSHISLCVKDHHIATISACTTAKAAWDALKAIHQAKNMARRQQLRRDLNSIKMGNAEPLTKYFNRAKTLWQELAATGDSLSESELVWTVLHGLPQEYDLMVTVFEAGDARDLSMDATLAKLLPIEVKIQRAEDEEIIEEDTTPALMVKHSRYQDNRVCWRCGQKGHLKKHCPKDKDDYKINNCAYAVGAIAL